MHRNFEAIDVFFIIIIALYFVILFVFLTIFFIKYFDIDKKENNINNQKSTKKIEAEGTSDVVGISADSSGAGLYSDIQLCAHVWNCDCFSKISYDRWD